MALGDALGGNILDVAFVIGLALLMGRLRCARHEIRRDFVVALLMRILIGVLALSGAITRVDGVVLLVIFFGWMVLISREAARQHSAAEIIQATQRRWLALLLSIVGFALLFAAGNLIVSGAQAIAFGWGVDTFIIGAVVVSIGTSIPEMAITLLAKYRGHDEVGVGTILGCNIYNGLLIVGTAAVIHPITIARQETLISIAFSLISLFLIWPTRQAVIPRWRGALLLALYAAYVVVLVGQAHRWQ
jgi:cation:H+ antiporter